MTHAGAHARTPVIVGAAQLTQRWESVEQQLDPLRLMLAVARRAFDDSGTSAIADAIDAVDVVNTITWSYADAPGLLVESLGVRPAHTRYTSVGGNTPQYLVNRACERLESGAIEAALLVGAEAGHSAQRARKLGVELGWPRFEKACEVDGDARSGASNLEFAYELMLPSLMYPLIETTLRARAGRSPSAHAAHLGALCERLSRVAATHPNAWFPIARDAERIAMPTSENRYVGYPYTKLMNAIMTVDQAAAIVLTTEERADALGIDRALRVYPMGGGDLNDVWHVTERPRLDESPALREAARYALDRAGISIGDVTTFDLYSCFPCAVQIASEMLGVAVDDPRGLTVTGGLPYFGGPGNNYSMHAIATMVDRIRCEPDTISMVTALGWYLTKHSVGIYGSRPTKNRWSGPGLASAQVAIEETALPPPLTRYDGPLVVEAFVIRHGRDGEARSGVVVGRSDRAERVVAGIDAGPAVLAQLEETELVGSAGRCRHDPASGRNLLSLA
jgi:acetyl-CoA C-acetyltransferase